jgi:hypothetical protein
MSPRSNTADCAAAASVLHAKKRRKNRAQYGGRIHIAPSPAGMVFITRTLPRSIELAFSAFPGIGQLPLDVQRTLVSLVFNRGGRFIESPARNDSHNAQRRRILKL